MIGDASRDAIEVAVPAFDGPLDLLLTLVRTNHYPLDRLPLAEITRQFTGYIKDAQAADIELGGEFIEIASWLVLLKSRSLLPPAAGEKLPEEELCQVLLDHETLTATARFLGERVEQAGLTAAPGRNIAEPLDQEEAAASPPSLQDALLAARRALDVAQAHQLAPGRAGDAFAVDAQIKRLRTEIASLPCGQPTSTAVWLAQEPLAAAAIFLALLEMARCQQLVLAQFREFGPILLKRVQDIEYVPSLLVG